MHRTRNAAYGQPYREVESPPLRHLRQKLFLSRSLFPTKGLRPPDRYTRVVHMDLPMTRPWKQPQSGVYWLRKRVPADLQAVIGRREEKRSLHTKDPAEAKVRHARALAEVEARWAGLRQGPRELTVLEAQALAASIYQQLVRQFADTPSGFSWNPALGARLW